MTQQTARVVIIGGGVLGCSLAYHLAKEGWTDIILLEKGELTSGSTWHAAGQITHAVSHYGLAKISDHGIKLYEQLEAETGQSCSWHPCGSLRLARDQDEMDALYNSQAIGQGLGHEMEIIPPEEIKKIHPFYNVEDVIAALHTPNDGHVDPAGVARAQAKGARDMGVRVIRGNRATGLARDSARGEWRVQTEQGDIICEHVVNAAGTYAAQVSKWVGIEELPVVNMVHHYFVTDTVPEYAARDQEVPVVRDDWVSGYIRQEQKSGLIGIYEKSNGRTVWDHGTPWEADSELFDPEYDRVGSWLERAFQKIPILENCGIKQAVVGAITHSLDGQGLIGPSGIHNFWQLCGVQVGIAAGPGIGKYLAQQMIHGSADVDMKPFDPLRYGARFNHAIRIQKGTEDYYHRHLVPFPHRNHPDCRPQYSKTTPIHNLLAEKGAVFQDVFGWERPAWFALNDEPREHIHSFRRSRLHQIVEGEVNAARGSVAICDLSAFAKIKLSGEGAAKLLERVSCNNLPQQGKVSLTYFINPNGRLQAESTLWRTGENDFYMSYAGVEEKALLHWLRCQASEAEEQALAFVNLSESFGVLLITGPRAREILAPVIEAPLTNEAFPWLSGQTVRAAGEDGIKALRVSYAGELGWELHIPFASMSRVYNALENAAQALEQPLHHIGAFALNAMRMEKAYKGGAELTNEVTITEAGLQRFARKDASFQGAEESLKPPKNWNLVYIKLAEPKPDQPQADPVNSEGVWHDGKPVGMITSSVFGYEAQAAVCWAYVDNPLSAAVGTQLEVPVLGAMRAAVVLEPKAIRDPANRLLKA